VPHFLTGLFDQFVQSERASQLRIDMDISLALDLAICLREAEPAWATVKALCAFEHWQLQLGQEPARDRIATGIPIHVNRVLDIFSTALPLHGFRNLQESQLWEMIQALVKWGLQGDAPAEAMTQLQTAIERVEDITLRHLLLAPVACGWLEAQDFTRVRHLLDRLDVNHLKRAGFYEKLSSLARLGTLDKVVLQDLRDLYLEVLLLTPTNTEAFIDAMTAWLELRLAVMREHGVKVKFIKAMLQLHQSLMGSQKEA